MSSKITFYGWTEHVPSNLTFAVSGGFPKKDAETGRMHNPPLKLAKFSAGVCSTDDAETIAKLRELMAKGDSITEDREVYLSHLHGPKKPTDRETQELNDQIAANDEEIKRLTAQVHRKSASPRKALRVNQLARKASR
jgi:hypothetical protein